MTFQWTTLALGVILQVLLISALLKGAYRQYPFLLAYAVSDVLNSVVMATAYFDLGRWTKANAKYYWIGEALQYTLIFALLLHLLWKVVRSHNRSKLLHVVGAGILYILGSIWLAHHENQNLWMTQTLRNINFGSIFLNLTLWTLLLQRKNRQMLLIVAAFGVQFAGVAIGHSLRQLSRDMVVLGNLVITASYFICLFSLWRAVSPVASSASQLQENSRTVSHDTDDIIDDCSRQRNSLPFAKG